jgi:predicted MFS family arabinose efflux permease
MGHFIDELRTAWRELLGGTIGLGLGIASYNPVSSMFFRSLEQEFGWSKAAAAISLIAMPITAAVLPFAGMALDRFGVRRVAFASTLCMAASFVWLSLMNGSLRMFYAAFIALNVLGCATGPIGYTRTIAFRFRRSRGTALAIALMGIGLAGVVLPPLLTWVFAGWGWRGGYAFYAAAVLAAGVAAMWLMRESRATNAQAEPAASGDTVTQAVRRAAFWLLGMAIFLVSVASLGFVSQFQSIIIEKGLEPKLAPTLLSSLAASVFLSRLVVGWGLDTLNAEWVAAGALLMAATGTLFWLVGEPSIAMAMTAILLLGLSIGAELDLMSFFCARIFGMRHYGGIYGALAFFFYTGIAAGGIAYGAIHDRIGSYDTAIILSTCLFVLSAGLFIALRSTAREVPLAEALAPEAAR